MNKSNYSTCSQSSIFDTDGPKLIDTSQEKLLSIGSKHKTAKGFIQYYRLTQEWKRITEV